MFVDSLVRFYGLRGRAILDYGCGAGAFSLMFSNYSDHVAACDLSRHNLTFTSKLTEGAVQVFEDDFFASRLVPDSYDFIYCRNLDPLHTIPFTPENSVRLRRIVSVLKEDGVAYFSLLGAMTGKSNADNGFVNHTLKEIYEFFSGAGHVAMINVLQKQAIIVTRQEATAARVRSKMRKAVLAAVRALSGWDEVSYVKYRLWLLTNGGEAPERASDFPIGEDLVRTYFDHLQIPQLANQRVVEDSTSDDYPVYMVSGDADRLGEADLAASLAFFRRTSRNPLYSTLSRIKRAVRGIR